jgi:hypothetical protein
MFEKLTLARMRLGLRQPSGAFDGHALSKAPEGWRTPKPVGKSNVSFQSETIATDVSDISAATRI